MSKPKSLHINSLSYYKTQNLNWVESIFSCTKRKKKVSSQTQSMVEKLILEEKFVEKCSSHSMGALYIFENSKILLLIFEDISALKITTDIFILPHISLLSKFGSEIRIIWSGLRDVFP